MRDTHPVRSQARPRCQGGDDSAVGGRGSRKLYRSCLESCLRARSIAVTGTGVRECHRGQAQIAKTKFGTVEIRCKPQEDNVVEVTNDDVVIAHHEHRGSAANIDPVKPIARKKLWPPGWRGPKYGMWRHLLRHWAAYVDQRVSKTARYCEMTEIADLAYRRSKYCRYTRKV